jgi:hypothetical protein
LGTLLVMSQSAYALTISVTSAGLPSMGISLGQVSVGRRPSQNAMVFADRPRAAH